MRTLGPIAVFTAFVLTALTPAGSGRAAAQVEVAEASIRELQEAMSAGRATSVQITQAYLARIEAYDHAGPRLNAMLRLNPDALREARARDRERAEGRVRGPLHGIPVVLKDNYDTFDMPTSAGTLALAGLVPPGDAFQVRKLREAGAVILGKTNMHELASGITTIGSLGGQTLNPYDPTRNPGGSSGGTGAAVAASFAAVGWGSDTCGSIRIPAAHNNLVGLRPTKGLSSIDGIIPLSHTQDVGGPLARSVEDLAIALDATIGPDPADPATTSLRGRALPGFVDALEGATLEGTRIGLFEPLFGDDPEDQTVGDVVREAARAMEAMGATVVSVEVERFQSLIGGSSVIGHEFKWDLMDYLAGVPQAPVASLGEMIDLGLIHDAVIGTMRLWNEPAARESDEYLAALAAREELRTAILGEMDTLDLDVLLYPTIRRVAARVGEPQRGSGCQLSAHTGLPALAVPAGWADGLPVGMELLARPFDDARLLAWGHAFEEAADLRRAPPLASAPPSTSADPIVFDVRVSGADASLMGRLEYDAVASTLGYTYTVALARRGRVYAVVLRHTDDAGRWSVASHLSGPGMLAAEGTVSLTDTVREQLEQGELYIEILTRGSPVESARSALILPSQ